MPYIKKEDRKPYQELLKAISASIKETINQKIKEDPFLEKQDLRWEYLNFVINYLVDVVWGPVEGRRYADHQDVTGFLVCAAAEYHRRYSAPYQEMHPQEFVKIRGADIHSKVVYDKKTLKILGNMVPKDKMARSGNMNYIISYIIDEVWGPLTERTLEDHFSAEKVLEDTAYNYYNNITAPYEDTKINDPICGDLKDI